MPMVQTIVDARGIRLRVTICFSFPPFAILFSFYCNPYIVNDPAFMKRKLVCEIGQFRPPLLS